MNKYADVIKRYTDKGVSADTIEYAISFVKEGAKREHILESLTAGVCSQWKPICCGRTVSDEQWRI
jgi:hypothetical protein